MLVQCEWMCLKMMCSIGREFCLSTLTYVSVLLL